MSKSPLGKVALRRWEHTVECGKQLFKAESASIFRRDSTKSRRGLSTDHDTEAQAKRAGKEGTAVLYPEARLAGYVANDEVDTYHAGAEDAC